MFKNLLVLAALAIVILVAAVVLTLATSPAVPAVPSALVPTSLPPTPAPTWTPNYVTVTPSPTPKALVVTPVLSKEEKRIAFWVEIQPLLGGFGRIISSSFIYLLYPLYPVAYFSLICKFHQFIIVKICNIKEIGYMVLEAVLSQAVGLRGVPVEVKGTIDVSVASVVCLSRALEAWFWNAMRSTDFSYLAEVVASVTLTDPVAVLTLRRSANQGYSPKAWRLG